VLISLVACKRFFVLTDFMDHCREGPQNYISLVKGKSHNFGQFNFVSSRDLSYYYYYYYY
jgi:hypothetical protein